MVQKKDFDDIYGSFHSKQPETISIMIIIKIAYSSIYKVITKHSTALLTHKKSCMKLSFSCTQNFYSCKVSMSHLYSTALNMFLLFLWSIFLFSLAFSLFSPCLSLTLCVCQRWVSEKLSVESLRDLELFGGEVQGKPRSNKRVQHLQTTAYTLDPSSAQTDKGILF